MTDTNHNSAHQVVPLEDFPGDPDEITAQWLERMLASYEIDVAVDTVTHTRIGTGQIGQNHRYLISYTDARAAAEQGAPVSLVGKFVSPDPVSRGTGLMMGIYAKEAAFYRKLAPLLAGKMRLATAWVAEFDAEREATLVLMEDLSPATQGDQMEACSVETAEQAVRELAALHATFWEHDVLTSASPEYATIMSNPTEPMRVMILLHLVNTHWPEFKDRYASQLTAAMIELGDHLVEKISPWALGRTGPRTLVHSDYRADNLMITSGWTTAVDWQTVSVGFGGNDLGYFLGASLLPDDRRAHQDRLVDLWLAELSRNGVHTYNREDAWNEYRNGQFGGIITAVISSMITQRTDRGDAMFWAMAGRHFETALETNAAELL
jgi:aminoglycoside/choline kinase family phosphotransferase